MKKSNKRGKATQIHLVEKGKIPKGREDEPMPDPREPIWAKATLNKREIAVWDRLAPVILRNGLLTEADGENFANVCRIVARIEQIDEILAQPETQLLIMYTESAPNGTEKPVIKINPLLSEQRQLMKDLRLYAPEFGLTPRGRVGLSVGDREDKKSKLAGLID